MAAKELGISLDLIRILPTNSMTSPNSCMTGGSITTEYNCQVKQLLANTSTYIISDVYHISLYVKPLLFVILFCAIRWKGIQRCWSGLIIV